LNYTLNNLDDILNCYGERQIKYFYSDKKFNIKGIDYTRYIKLWFKSIHEYHIRDIYGVNGWYLLFHLMAHAKDGIYIETTLDIISSKIKLKNIEIKDLLFHLQKHNIVKLKEDKFDKNTLLHIAIGYQDNNIIQVDNGYRAIPIDYLITILPTISPTEWAILSVLLVNFSYFQPTRYISQDTGEILYGYQENYYAFPKLETIAELVGVVEKTVRTYVSKLEGNPYKIIEVKKGKRYTYINDDGNPRQGQEVNKYYIPLLDRIEYIYHHIYNIDDSEANTNRQENIKEIKKKGFDKIVKSEQQNILIVKDFINYKHKNLMTDYENILKEMDDERYKKINKYASKY
jgi:hypothetical protein